jgi:hypothetical protein
MSAMSATAVEPRPESTSSRGPESTSSRGPEEHLEPRAGGEHDESQGDGADYRSRENTR